MSEGTHNIGDEQAVVGEPASHPHQAVVVGEPPEAVDPVLGEPAFANGLQDRQPTLPPSAEETSANGVQSVSLTPPSSHVSTPAEESPNLQQAPSAEARESGIGESDTHQLEPPVAENPGLSGAVADEASGASDAPAVRSTAAGTPARSAEEESADDFPDVVEVTHIVDSPSQYSPSLSEAPSQNPYAALDEEDESESAPVENLSSDSALTDGAPTPNASSAPDEISTKGLGDQQEESSFLSAAQDKPPTEGSRAIQTDSEDGSLEGSKAANENVSTAEPEQGGQGDVLGQKSDSKEANLEKEDNGSSGSPSGELDRGTERAIEDTALEPETTARDVGNSLSKESNELEASTVESPTSNKDKLDENHIAPRNLELQSKEEELDGLPPVNSSVGTRDISVEDGLVNQPRPAANGNDSYQHGEHGLVEREQDLPKVDEDGSAEAEKSGFRSKLPLIFTGLAIAAVGVVVASISRSR